MKKILGVLVLTIICCLNLNADLNEGLVAHYPFNGNANDVSENGNDGTTYGEIQLIHDRFGNGNCAYEFDGVDDYINCGNDQSLWIGNDDFTISVWIKTVVTGEFTDSFVILKRGSNNAQWFDIRSYGATASFTGGIHNYRIDPNSQLDLVDGIWHNSVFVREATSGYLYIDGILCANDSNPNLTNYTGDIYDLVIGQWYTSNVSTDFYNGLIDDIRIYNRALTESEIHELYFHSNFTALETDVSIGEQIQFTDTSTGNPTTWEWDFENDGIYDSTYYSYQDTIYWTYENEGTYSVKLKISNETFVDSLIKENLITVSYCPPDTVQNVQLVIDHPNANISWDAVTTNENGATIEVDGYIVLFSENDEDYFYLYSTTETNYSHIRVAEHRAQMFYNVIAFKNYNREQIEYLESLNNLREKLKWSEVKLKLKEKRGINFEN